MSKPNSKILHGLLLATTGLVASTVIASTAAAHGGGGAPTGGGPTGPTVVVGSATITNNSNSKTTVNQTSNKALINWDSFSIPTGSTVQFVQPNSNAIAVNRVTGNNASTIDGALLANGNVWLINANGILFGSHSQINVGALIATTSDINNDDFKNGKYTFQPASNANASVDNKGTITVNQGGSVVLSAPQVSNEGLIQANLGTVVLGGAKAFTVDLNGDNLLTYEITAPVTSAPKTGDHGSVAAALVSNSGQIEAAGGRVILTTRAAQNVQDNVINNTGMVEATTVSSHNGEIDLDAGANGTVNDSGTLDTSGSDHGETGGAVNVTGNTINIADHATINASGDAGGGTIQIGGGLHGQGSLAHAQNTNVGNATIRADATGTGNGGTVVLWSDGNTSVSGTITSKGGAHGGNGGEIETSGQNFVVGNTTDVETSAPLGLTGEWLIDPKEIDVGLVEAFVIDLALRSTNITLQATGNRG
ncbi:MAG TPA: filamentous hemagglutinin N-terminal domain-containing protein, partial [Pirellulales bacterium]|nr:filamentous hemagglutinin N-terminal domain-containing protein [Pirellulales bacterium]